MAQNLPEQDVSTYPRQNIDPAKKDAAWGVAYAKAAYYDWMYTYPKTVFNNAYGAYEQMRLYAMGKQPINQYKKLMGVDEETNNTWLNIDWSIRPIVSKYRSIAIARLVEGEYNVVATPIDPSAKAELDKLYSDMKAKIAVRNLMQQQNPDLANHPLLQPGAGEPWDMEEMQMRIDFGEQFNRSKDAEEAIQLAFYKNGIKEYRKKITEDMFDCGVSGYYEDLDENGEPMFRFVNPESVITNYCRFRDFRDLQHAGEVIDVSLSDLATITGDDGQPVFSDEQLEKLTEDIAGKWTNPSNLGRSNTYYKGYDRFKVKVFQLQFYSYNELNWRNTVNEKGNAVFHEAEFSRGKGSAKGKYTRKKVQVVYKINWIIGTDYSYGFGLKENQKRSVDTSKKGRTSLSYKFYAPNFYEMRAQGMMERLIPLCDEYQLTCYKVQNFKNRMVPSGWWIDLDALEGVALGKSGENMKPKELLDMFFQSGVLVGRSKDLFGEVSNNYKPVMNIENSTANELMVLFQDMQRIIGQMEAICGFNSVTAGQPAPKMLTPGYDAAQATTDNSLFEIAFGERYLLESLASDMMLRIQQSIKIKGSYEGYAPALNKNTLKFIAASKGLPLSDYGIMLEERPTDEQRQLLMQMMNQDLLNGTLDASDVFMVADTYNLKQAQQMLAYKAKKNKAAAQAAQQAMNQQTIQGQQQSAQQTAQMKMQLEQMQAQFDQQRQDSINQTNLLIAHLKTTQTATTASETNQVKLATHLNPSGGDVLQAQTAPVEGAAQ